jgi:hypothetical protein
VSRIRPRERDTILQSLSAGVVPRRGHQHIQVGRSDEIQALMRDLKRIADEGAAIRFIIGRYGSGKTFFLHLIRAIALEQGLVTMHADLAPDRRLQASGGQAQNLYQELAINVATRTSPEGGALGSVVERFISHALSEARKRGETPTVVLEEKLAALTEMVGGYDFATVVHAYWTGHDEGRPELKDSAIRWLRGEYTTKTDARTDLGVRSYIDDKALYDHLKLFASFVRLAGYAGLVIALDEMVNLYKISHTQSRRANYEQVLRILNDCLQGSVSGLGFLLGGTPEFLMDPRRGLYSYEALQTRLQENAFAGFEYKDLSGPVVRLPNLTEEEMYVLLRKLRHVQAGGSEEDYLVPDQALVAFMEHCSERIGAEYFQTPRNTIKAFVQLLAVLDQNPDAEWQELIGGVEVDDDVEPSREDIVSDGDDELAGFMI